MVYIKKEPRQFYLLWLVIWVEVSPHKEIFLRGFRKGPVNFICYDLWFDWKAVHMKTFFSEDSEKVQSILFVMTCDLNGSQSTRRNSSKKIHESSSQFSLAWLVIIQVYRFNPNCYPFCVCVRRDISSLNKGKFDDNIKLDRRKCKSSFKVAGIGVQSDRYLSSVDAIQIMQGKFTSFKTPSIQFQKISNLLNSQVSLVHKIYFCVQQT